MWTRGPSAGTAGLVSERLNAGFRGRPPHQRPPLQGLKDCGGFLLIKGNWGGIDPAMAAAEGLFSLEESTFCAQSDGLSAETLAVCLTRDESQSPVSLCWQKLE